ncbi:hypothetical protein F5Y19DRAFT_88541 [Xylariaceae sp. FL1651]|nr:hypothetical protein F5Y19DRAFT_88541 [Xylariaceae sp. FL1651]
MSSMNINAPGAYPATPSLEEPTEQTHHNKLHKREDPRSWNDSTEQNPRSSGHNFTDSGINVDNAYRGRGSDKPGVMTGAFSRIGNQDGGYTQNNDYTYDRSPVSHPTYDETSRQSNTMKPIATSTDGAIPNTTPSKSTNLDSNTTTKTAESQGRNLVRSGLHGQSNIEHKEPYWGDIPFGTGIYNGVTGHGSNEPISYHKPHGDQNTTTNEHSNQQRAFPLSTNMDTTSSDKETAIHEYKRDSRFEEGLPDTRATSGISDHVLPSQMRTDQPMQHSTAEKPDSISHRAATYGKADSKPAVAQTDKTDTKSRHEKDMATAGAATAFGVHEHAKRDEKKKTKDEQPEKTGESKLHALLHPFSHKDKGSIKDEQKESHSHRDHVATPTKAHTQTESRRLERQPQPVNEQSHVKEDSNHGNYGTAATAATGAGLSATYGARNYANRDNSGHLGQDSSKDSENKFSPSALSQATTHDSARNNAPLTAAGGIKQSHNNNHFNPQSGQELNAPSDGTSSGIAAGTNQRSTSRGSSDSSHGGQYNVLSSGTPSGINIDQSTSHGPSSTINSASPVAPGPETSFSQKRQQQMPAAYLSNAPPSPKRPLEQSQASGGGANPAKESGPISSEYATKDAANEGQALQDFQMSAQAMTQKHQKESNNGLAEKKVTHRCVKCGEENDISDYLKA